MTLLNRAKRIIGYVFLFTQLTLLDHGVFSYRQGRDSELSSNRPPSNRPPQPPSETDPTKTVTSHVGDGGGVRVRHRGPARTETSCPRDPDKQTRTQGRQGRPFFHQPVHRPTEDSTETRGAQTTKTSLWPSAQYPVETSLKSPSETH